MIHCILAFSGCCLQLTQRRHVHGAQWSKDVWVTPPRAHSSSVCLSISCPIGIWWRSACAEGAGRAGMQGAAHCADPGVMLTRGDADQGRCTSSWE